MDTNDDTREHKPKGWLVWRPHALAHLFVCDCGDHGPRRILNGFAVLDGYRHSARTGHMPRPNGGAA